MSTGEKLAMAIDRLARATEENTRVLEVLVEAMPATKEAELLGVSEKTVRRRRKIRRAARLLSVA